MVAMATLTGCGGAGRHPPAATLMSCGNQATLRLPAAGAYRVTIHRVYADGSTSDSASSLQAGAVGQIDTASTGPQTPGTKSPVSCSVRTVSYQAARW
jgi:hypothetical protein